MSEIDSDATSSESKVIGVCVGKEQKGLNSLKWALDNIVPSQGFVYLLHVSSPLRWIPSPLGGKLPVNQVKADHVKRFKDERLIDTNNLVSRYRKLCDKKKVRSKLCYAENDSVPKELVDQISKLGITDLVLESSPSSLLMVRKAESTSAYVAKFAPEFCTVMVVRKEKLHSVKQSTQLAPPRCSSLSILVASDLSISLDSGSSLSGQRVEDHFGGSQIVDRSLQPGVKVDLGKTAHGRLQQSMSMDLTSCSTPHYGDRGGYPNSVGRMEMRRCGTTQPQNRLFKSAPETPCFQQVLSPHDSSSPQSIGGFESRTSLASDNGSLEEAFSENDSRGHDFSTPTGMPLENFSCLTLSPLTTDRLYRTGYSPDCDLLSQGSVEMVHSTSSHTLEGSPSRIPWLDSNTEFASSKESQSLPTLNFDLLQSQLNKAKQSAHWAQIQAEREAINFRTAEEVVANAKKMMLEHEKHRDKALNELKRALDKASEYERMSQEAMVAAQISLRDQDTLQTRLAEEVKRHEETQIELETQKRIAEAHANELELAKEQAQEERSRCEAALRKCDEEKIKLEEVTKKLEEECRLRKEAERMVAQALLALQKEQKQYTEYSLEELQLATNNFDEENKLGQGGYGPVYKGKLHHTTVAIKVLAREGPQGRDEFQKEVEVLSCIHHPHMVILLGACSEKGYIVYEYMANGSLEDRLNCRDGHPALPWFVRFRICREVATALLFLHSRPQPIVHRDLKPGNILLDHHFVSKVSDAGLAKLVPNNVTFSLTMYKETVMAGTLAYMDPDYQRTGVVSPESDVYALGIVMLQLLTGRPPVGVIDLVEDAVDNIKLEEVLDKSAGEWPLTEAMALACVSLQCVEPRRKYRPSLKKVVLPDLESIQGVADSAAASMAHLGSSTSSTLPLIPSSFFCPISQEIMENPYLSADGFTYEHDNIKVWLQEHDTSPMTNLVLHHKNLIPNYSLRSAIKEWYDNGGIPV